MQPLDLVFFKGSDLVSRVILKVGQITNNDQEFSHVGIIVNKDILCINDLDPNKLYILESTVNTKNDRIEGRQIGVQLRQLDTTIESYKCNPENKVAWVKLLNNPYVSNKENTIIMFKRIYENYINRHYEMNIFSLIAAAFPCFKGVRNIFKKVRIGNEYIFTSTFQDSVFCSELVCKIYLDLGIMPNFIDTEDLMPVELLNYSFLEVPKYI